MGKWGLLLMEFFFCFHIFSLDWIGYYSINSSTCIKLDFDLIGLGWIVGFFLQLDWIGLDWIALG